MDQNRVKDFAHKGLLRFAIAAMIASSSACANHASSADGLTTASVYQILSAGPLKVDWTLLESTPTAAALVSIIGHSTDAEMQVNGFALSHVRTELIGQKAALDALSASWPTLADLWRGLKIDVSAVSYVGVAGSLQRLAQRIPGTSLGLTAGLRLCHPPVKTLDDPRIASAVSKVPQHFLTQAKTHPTDPSDLTVWSSKYGISSNLNNAGAAIYHAVLDEGGVAASEDWLKAVHDESAFPAYTDPREDEAINANVYGAEVLNLAYSLPQDGGGCPAS